MTSRAYVYASAARVKFARWSPARLSALKVLVPVVLTSVPVAFVKKPWLSAPVPV